MLDPVNVRTLREFGTVFRDNANFGDHPDGVHGKHVLVTGGAGFIGSHLVERLLSEGESVIVIDDLSTGLKHNLKIAEANTRFQWIQRTVSSTPNLVELVAESSQVFHLAAAVGVERVVKSPVHTIETNLHESEVLFRAASRHRIPVLLTSTSEVYGRSPKQRFSETDDLVIGPPQIARWSYACSKLMDEFLALAHHQESGLPVKIVRLFNIVGPRQTGEHGMVLPRFIEAALKGQPLRVYGSGDQTRCFCHVEDCVEALIRLWRSSEALGQVVNVGGDDIVSIRHLADRVIRILNSASTIESISYEQVFRSGFEDMLHRQPNLARLKELTRFHPVQSIDHIIRDTANWIGNRAGFRP